MYPSLKSSSESESSILKGLVSAVDPGLGFYIILKGFRDRVLARGLDLLGYT